MSAIRKRAAALLEKEMTEDEDENEDENADAGEDEDEDEDLPPPKTSRASKRRRRNTKLCDSEEEGISDEAEHIVDTVKDLLDFNNDFSMEDEVGDNGIDDANGIHYANKPSIFLGNQSSDEDDDMVEDDTGRKKGVSRLLDKDEVSVIYVIDWAHSSCR